MNWKAGFNGAIDDEFESESIEGCSDNGDNHASLGK